MKLGPRTPNLKKSFKARTTGQVKRKIKSSVNPLYGKKGMGLINDPKKAIYNKVYNKTTFDTLKPLKSSGKNKKAAAKNNTVKEKMPKEKKYKIFSVICYILSVSAFFSDEPSMIIKIISAVIFFIIGRILWKKSLPEAVVEMTYEEFEEFSKLNDEEKIAYLEKTE